MDVKCFFKHKLRETCLFSVSLDVIQLEELSVAVEIS